MKLFIGDGSINSYLQCKNIFGTCELLDNSTIIDDDKNYHTSIYDVKPLLLNSLIDRADKVIIGNIKNDDLLIQAILRNKKLLPFSDVLGDEIEISSDQLVAIGCSHTYGIELEKYERYSALVAKNLDLQELNLGKPGGGISYVSNTFHRCKFNSKQKVIFQIPSPDRTYSLSINEYKKLDFNNKNDLKILSVLSDDLLLATAYSNITNAIYTARRLDLNFVCFILSNNSSVVTKLDYLLSGFMEYMPLYDYCKDYTSDGHFGKNTHQNLANLITDYFKNKN